jgi:hypothetical protein
VRFTSGLRCEAPATHLHFFQFNTPPTRSVAQRSLTTSSKPDAATTTFLRRYGHQTKMTLNTATPLAATTDDQTPTSDEEQSRLLRLAPELRNRIYHYAFSEVNTTGLVPHALTQTNRQIRRECRAMYYASIHCLEINLRTFAQYHRTEKWLAEQDWSLFPVLPDITFLSYDKARDLDVKISCHRESIVPAHNSLVSLPILKAGTRASGRGSAEHTPRALDSTRRNSCSKAKFRTLSLESSVVVINGPCVAWITTKRTGYCSANS